MRTLGWFLLVGGGIVSIATYAIEFDGSVRMNWTANACALIGLLLVYATKKLLLESGEILHYTGSAMAGEGNAFNSRSKTWFKLAVTSKGLKYGPFGRQNQQAVIPFGAINYADRLGPVSVRVHYQSEEGQSTSLKLQFVVFQSVKFLRALAQNGTRIEGWTYAVGGFSIPAAVGMVVVIIGIGAYALNDSPSLGQILSQIENRVVSLQPDKARATIYREYVSADDKAQIENKNEARQNDSRASAWEKGSAEPAAKAKAKILPGWAPWLAEMNGVWVDASGANTQIYFSPTAMVIRESAITLPMQIIGIDEDNDTVTFNIRMKTLFSREALQVLTKTQVLQERIHEYEVSIHELMLKDLNQPGNENSNKILIDEYQTKIDELKQKADYLATAEGKVEEETARRNAQAIEDANQAAAETHQVTLRRLWNDTHTRFTLAIYYPNIGLQAASSQELGFMRGLLPNEEIELATFRKAN